MKLRCALFFLLGVILGLLAAIITLNYKLDAYKSAFSIPEAAMLFDPAALIRIHTKQDIATFRSALIEYIWQDKYLPSALPGSVEQSYLDPRFEASRIDRITIDMAYGIQSIAYLFHPAIWNHRLVIYHEGHDGDFSAGKQTIEFFLQNGYQVLAFSMPLVGMNDKPVVNLAGLGPLKIATHEQMKFLDKPFSFFLEPVAIGLNYVEQQYHPEIIAMVGISGGGWTTTLYAAIDQRITYSYPVAGSLPIGLRYSTGGDWGDWEQTEPGLYATANYYELYILGASNGRQVQILNQFDSCCFGGERGKLYEQMVNTASAQLGGQFQVFIDASHKKHIISPKALSLILDDLK